MSKKLKLKFKGVYTVVAILKASNGDDKAGMYRIKP